jgi:Domain of unknown function (DUF5666)
MRRTAAVLVTATLAIVWLAVVMAAPQDKWARGKVTAMSGSTVTIDVKGQPMTFTVDPATRFIARGASTKAREAEKMGTKRTLADVVKVGDSVQVSYAESGGALLAREIRVGIGASPATSAEEPKEVEGVVSEMSGKSITVQPESGEAVTFMLDSGIRVEGRGLGTLADQKRAEGAKVKLSQAVAVGDTIHVTYKAVGDMKHATAVRVVKKKTS